MPPATLKSSFRPVVAPHVRVLILGSLPGEVSLQRAQYYAHPQNRFWHLVGGVIGTDLVTLEYEARLAAVLGAGIGLWDSVQSAERPGSLDAAIRNHTPNALPALVATLPELRAIAFNGGKSAAIGRRVLGDGGGLALVNLPSSSPAYAGMSFARKLEAWMVLRTFLDSQVRGQVLCSRGLTRGVAVSK